MNRPRPRSKADIYHITSRGTGRLIIFEDNQDRSHYLSTLLNKLEGRKGLLDAWCLMSNHVHLLVKLDMDDLSLLMHDLNLTYAKYFNARHSRAGRLLQGPFGSVPINTEAQIMETVRYIHMNPVKAGLCKKPGDYLWSSYRSYTGEAQEHFATGKDEVLEIFGSIDDFISFHEEDDAMNEPTDIVFPQRRLDDDEALEKLKNLLHGRDVKTLASCNKPERDTVIHELKKHGLSIRQIERLTGIGRGIIYRA